MASFTKKRLLLIITNSYAATNVIHSSLIKPLACDYEVYIISDLIRQKDIQEINQHFGITTYKIDISIPVETPLIKVLRLFEKALFLHLFNIETQKIKIREKAFWFRFGAELVLGFFKLSGLGKILLKFLRREIIRQTGNNPSLDELLQYKFSGVVSSSPLDIRENSIVNFLKKGDIPSLAIIISWDNLTSKGIINADHNYVLVWNKLMEDDYNRFYSIFNVSNQSIYPTGIPRFDTYFKRIDDTDSKLKFYEKYKLNGTDKIILFTTSSIAHFPNQTDIVKHLLEYISQNQNIKIIVRCHPSDNFALYEQFQDHPDLRIWHQNDDQIRHSQFLKVPDLNVLNNLHEMLKYCNVCINVASTIRMEAAVCNKPGISIAYDGNLKVPFQKSVRRFYDYSHQIPLNAMKIDQTVFSKNQLFDSLDEILSSDLKYHYAHRIKKFVHHSGPFAVPSTMKYIRQWLN